MGPSRHALPSLRVPVHLSTARASECIFVIIVANASGESCAFDLFSQAHNCGTFLPSPTLTQTSYNAAETKTRP